ncbi:MAG TPA: hypothetical protein VG826_04375 [Pirellulales bacterium]|nr:hypothetical protein [Pirellulales bacterium]
MAAGTTSPETSPARQGLADPFGSQVIAYDRYIETQLHRTRRQVKGVDFSTSMMLLVVTSLVYLMLVALLDHWVVKGGLSVAGRVAAFGVLAAGAAAFALFKLLPLAMRRVNPVYAAYTIEQHRPGLKNSLINFLLLRSGSERLPEKIYEAMEVQAANALSSAHAEVAVDRAPLIRLLLALVAAVFLVALYAVLSPKNPFTSFRRVMSPWSDVAPPTRVLIRDIQPGDANGFHDQHLAVSAQIDGVRAGEPITLRYSTVDGQVLARAVPMTKPENGYRFAAELPPDNLGLQQDLEYWIEAGDAFSPHHKIKVDTAPTIVVEEIEYQYPKYSELPPRTVARHGDIQGLVGTRVTLRAKANQPIRQADLDFECDGRNDLDMQVDGTRATVSFSLVWSDSLRRPEHESYQLRFRNQDGHENPKPIRYTIEVIRDLPPEVELVEPELDPSKDLVVPAGRPVRFAVQAADPDFKLAAVKFQARRGKTPLVEDSLLAEPRAGQFRRDYLLDLKRLEVKPGELIEFWASADDNREPDSNHGETPHYRLRVASADEQGQGQDDQNAQNPDQNQQPKQDDGRKNQAGKRHGENREGGEEGDAGEAQPDDQNKPGDKSKEGKKNERKKETGKESGEQGSSNAGENGQRGSSDKPQTGEGNSGEQKPEGGNSDTSDNPERGGQGSENQGTEKQGGENSDESKRVDPERDAGKAIDEINKYFNEKNKDNKSGENDSQQKKQPDQQQEADQQSGDQKSGDNKNGHSDGKAGKEAGDQKKGSTEGGPSQSGGKPGNQPKSAGESKEKQSTTEPGENGDGKNGDEKQTRTGQKQTGERKGEDADSQEGRPKDGGDRQGAKEQPDRSKTGEEGQTQQGDKPQDQSDGAQGKKKKSDDNNGPLTDKQNDQKGGPGDQAGARNEGDQDQGEKPGAKNGKKPSAGEKTQSGDKQGSANEGSDKSEKDKTGDGKQGDSKEGDEEAKQADGETHPREGQGGQAKGAGEPDDKVKKHKGESPDQKGGDPDSKDKGDGGAGDSEGANKHGAPAPQNQTQDRKKNQLSPDAKKGTSEDEPESPASRSKRQSDSQGAQQGDREGGGKSGGGQRSNSEGTGSAGQNSEADEGGGQGETQGKGATGEKGGDQQKSDKPTGGKPSGEKGPGSNQGQGQESDKGRKAESPETADPRGHNNASNQPGQPDRDSDKNAEKQPNGKRPPAPQNRDDKKKAEGAPQPSANNEGVDGEPTPSDRGGNDVRSGRQRSNPTGGGEPGPDETTPAEETDDSEPGGDDPNQEYARKATDLALDRLKDQLAKDKPDQELLDKLKWSQEDLERFVQQWDRLKKAADESGPKGDAARQELDDALRSLGLRPRGSSLTGGQKRDDKLRNLRESRRAPPPPEYQEQYIEFNKARAKGTK